MLFSGIHHGVDYSRYVTGQLSREQREAVDIRDFALARKLGVSVDDYLKVAGCRNIK